MPNIVPSERSDFDFETAEKRLLNVINCMNNNPKGLDIDESPTEEIGLIKMAARGEFFKGFSRDNPEKLAKKLADFFNEQIKDSLREAS